MASRVSVTVPIWFSLISAALPMPRSMALVMIAGLVQKMSSPGPRGRPVRQSYGDSQCRAPP